MTRLDVEQDRTVTRPGPPSGLEGARSHLSGVTASLLWLLAGLFFVFCLMQLDIGGDQLARFAERLSFVVGLMLPPVVEDPGNLATAAIESIQVAIVGTIFGIILSLLLAVFAARNVSPIGPLSWVVKAFAAFVRAVPALVFALLFIVAVGLGPTAGILALAINSTGMLVKVYAETIEEIPMGPVEALRANGASPMQVVLQGVLPSVAGIFVAWSIFRFDINIRYASVLGIVGAGGIGWELVRAAHIARYDIAVGVTLVIFSMVLATEFVSGRLRRRVDSPDLDAAI